MKRAERLVSCPGSLEREITADDLDDVIRRRDQFKSFLGDFAHSLNPKKRRLNLSTEYTKEHETKRLQSILGLFRCHIPGETSHFFDLLNFRMFRVFRGPNSFLSS